MTESYLTDEAMSVVGRVSPARTGLVTAKDIGKFCAAIDEDNPLYLDPDAARAAGYADVISPPLFNASTTRPTPHRAGLLADGQYASAAPPGLGHLQTMLAGQSWDITRPTVAGERVVEISTTKSITERQGSTGAMVFVESETSVTTAAGEPIERYTSTLILRRPPPPRPPYTGSDGPAAAAIDLPATERTPDGLIKRPDMISLFMFCATIWAVHRIHWDTPYAQLEGLPLPILPGWMLSSYLAQLAEMRAPAGSRLQRLALRYRGSAFPGDTLNCTIAPGGGATESALSMVNQAGAELLSGHAAYAARD
jgi:acyl dehydratase